MKKHAAFLFVSFLLAVLLISCGGMSKSSTPSPVSAPGSLMVAAADLPPGDLFLTYTADDIAFFPITPGVSIEGLAPGSYWIHASSQIRNTTELYTPYWTRLGVSVRSSEVTQANVIYQHQYLASGNIEYHISGFPNGTSPRIGRFMVIGERDNAWVYDSLSPDQPVVTVSSAAGSWNIGGQSQGVDGRNYTTTANPSNISVLPGQTAVVTLSYTMAP